MDYFDEMGWQPIDAEQTQNHQLLLVARFLQDHGFFQHGFNTDELAPPAAKEIIENLEEKQIKATDEPCSICLKPNSEDLNAVFKVLPCSHAFHGTCILPWLQRTNSCPLCRFEMKTDDVEYEEMKNQQSRARQRQEDLDTLHDSMFG